MRKPLLIVLLFSLAGCVSVPAPRPPETDLPAAWPGGRDEARVPAQWWKAFGDPALDALVDEALIHNRDVLLAAARIEEARAALGLARADLFPSVALGADASRSRRTEVGSMPVPADPVSNSYAVKLQAAYEVDLWGRYRQASEAARANLLASEFAREVVRVSLAGEVVQGYFALRALDAQAGNARQTLDNRRQAVDIMKQRLAVGLVSELELRQAEAEAAAAESSLSGLLRQGSLQEHALALLAGRDPRHILEGSIARGAALDDLPQPPGVPAGLPSELLVRRPDIRQAEQTLAAARARIAEVRAALYPSLSLTAYLGSESRDLANLFSVPANVWGLTAGIAQTIFNAGRTESAVQVATARQEQALIAYEQTVRQAFREVLDALVTHRQARELGESEGRRVAALRRALELARLRHEQGLSGYLEVLDTQRNLYQVEQSLIDARRLQLATAASLATALGGGWEPTVREQGAQQAN